MGRPRLPLASSERSRHDKDLLGAALIVVLGVASAALALSTDGVLLAALVAAPAIAYAAAVWSIRMRMPWLTAALMALVAVLLGYLTGHPLVGAALAALVVGWIAWQTHVRMDPGTIKPLAADTNDASSAVHVTAFESLGCERVGALSFETSEGRTIVATVLIGPQGDRYGVATDIVLTVQSIFGERVLTTKNSGVVRLPPEILANDLRGADAIELFDAHEQALAILRARGLTPDRLRPDRLLDLHMAIERRAIEWANSRSRRQAFDTFIGSGKGEGALDGSPGSRSRIDAWLSAPTPVA